MLKIEDPQKGDPLRAWRDVPGSKIRLGAMAGALKDLKRFGDAEALYRRTLELMTKALGPSRAP